MGSQEHRVTPQSYSVDEVDTSALRGGPVRLKVSPTTWVFEDANRQLYIAVKGPGFSGPTGSLRRALDRIFWDTEP